MRTIRTIGREAILWGTIGTIGKGPYGPSGGVHRDDRNPGIAWGKGAPWARGPHTLERNTRTIGEGLRDRMGHREGTIGTIRRKDHRGRE